MNLLFLRGKADRPKDIAFDTLAADDDMWTHLAHGLLGPFDQGEVVYWGGDRWVDYSHRFRVIWTPKLKHWRPVHPVPGRDGDTATFCPDVCIARGGFEQYHSVIERLPANCLRVYYGAGKRFLPQSPNLWDVLLFDSVEQIVAAGQHIPPAAYVATFRKPAPPQFVVDEAQPKVYDVCYVATVPGDKRKRMKWVWETVPRHISVLQLGLPPTGTPPPNVKIKHVLRAKMPRYISRCRLTICPYTSADSGPRIISESLACGVPVLCSPDVYAPYVRETAEHLRKVARLEYFWRAAERMFFDELHSTLSVRRFYDKHFSLPVAAQHLAGVLAQARYVKEHHYNNR